MNGRLSRLGLAFAAVVAAASLSGAGVFARAPEYYVNRFGSPDATGESTALAFIHPGTEDVTEVRGRFSIRRFQERDVRIEATFLRSGLELVAVTIQRPAGWTLGDLHALLAEYGPQWRQLGAGMWISVEGARAIYRDGAFHLLSPRTVGEMDLVRFANAPQPPAGATRPVSSE